MMEGCGRRKKKPFLSGCQDSAIASEASPEAYLPFIVVLGCPRNGNTSKGYDPGVPLTEKIRPPSMGNLSSSPLTFAVLTKD
jgi:hypothetical protein